MTLWYVTIHLCKQITSHYLTLEDEKLMGDKRYQPRIATSVPGNTSLMQHAGLPGGTP